MVNTVSVLSNAFQIFKYQSRYICNRRIRHLYRYRCFCGSLQIVENNTVNTVKLSLYLQFEIDVVNYI